jgi:hypothetical protein
MVMNACAREELALLILIVLALLVALGFMAAVLVWATRRADEAGRRRYRRHLYAAHRKDGTA